MTAEAKKVADSLQAVDEDLSPEWEAEIARRIDAVERGESTLIPGDVVAGSKWMVSLVLLTLAACGDGEAASASTGSGTGTETGSSSGSAPSTTDNPTDDPTWNCPSDPVEVLVLTPLQVAQVLGDDVALTEENCRDVCNEYTMLEWQNVTGCEVAPAHHGGGSESTGTGSSSSDGPPIDTTGEGASSSDDGSESSGSADETGGGPDGPVAVTCRWFPNCM